MIFLQNQLSGLMVSGLIAGSVGAVGTFIFLHLYMTKTRFYLEVYRNFIPVKKFLYYVFFFSVSLFLAFLAFYLIASVFGLIDGRF
ncbi:hypothetical protein [Chryseosolibacter indicus]|uniref:Uncharacterized protein n=1 Tax=Chryseosolibacter indicus TaxID=2782351 RepID=A0ABS5VWP4_9BACT|nr:hypothetical protein [Chryseosolibacter indicus]MBT1705656.1 hypothetical protein [Chryseosolibacter indicus]